VAQLGVEGRRSSFVEGEVVFGQDVRPTTVGAHEEEEAVCTALEDEVDACGGIVIALHGLEACGVDKGEPVPLRVRPSTLSSPTPGSATSLER
jgi:hypothetical protein